MSFEWTELAFQERQTGNTAIFIFALSVLFVFLVLAAQYESWSLPLAIILIVPMAVLSALVGVMLAGHGQQHPDPDRPRGARRPRGEERDPDRRVRQAGGNEGKTPVEAVVEACRLRLRPILMTAFAFILGVVPLVIATGPGAEMRQALGTAVFSGMLGVTVFGLFLTPVFYVAARFVVIRMSRRRRLKPARIAVPDSTPAE